MNVDSNFEVEIAEGSSPSALSVQINKLLNDGYSLDTQSLQASIAKGQYSTSYTYCVVMTRPKQRASNI